MTHTKTHTNTQDLIRTQPTNKHTHTNDFHLSHFAVKRLVLLLYNGFQHTHTQKLDAVITQQTNY